MKTSLAIWAVASLLAASAVPGQAEPQKSYVGSLLVGSWVNQNNEEGSAVMTITSVDAATGELRGTYVPPAGAAAGKRFGVVGWVSSAPPIARQHNVVVVTFSTSLTTYGSVATWTGYVSDGKIVANWLNSRPNSGYEWDHLTTGQDTWIRKSQGQ